MVTKKSRARKISTADKQLDRLNTQFRKGKITLSGVKARRKKILKKLALD